jgi:hypothetical protein
MKDILRIIPMVNSASLLEDNIKFSKKKKKNFVGQSVKNILGVNLISSTANEIESF